MGSRVMSRMVLFIKTSPCMQDRQSSRCMLFSVDCTVLSHTQQTCRPVPRLTLKDVAACELMQLGGNMILCHENELRGRVNPFVKMLCLRFSNVEMLQKEDLKI